MVTILQTTFSKSFFVSKVLYSKISLNIVSKGSINDKPAFVQMVPNRRQAIICINIGLCYPRIYHSATMS